MEAFPATELIMTTGDLALVLGFLLQPGRIGLHHGKIES